MVAIQSQLMVAIKSHHMWCLFFQQHSEECQCEVV